MYELQDVAGHIFKVMGQGLEDQLLLVGTSFRQQASNIRMASATSPGKRDSAISGSRRTCSQYRLNI